jgi:hypothetical protein
MPKYAAGLRKTLQRKREPIVQQTQPAKTTYAETYYSEVTATAAKGRVVANGIPVTCILDSRAATSLITKSLMKALDLKISRPSKLVIVTANGSKV